MVAGLATIRCEAARDVIISPCRADENSRAVSPNPAPRQGLAAALDDPCWATAAVFDDFRQSLPVEGAAPSERTEVRVLYDHGALYFGIRRFDSAPSGIIARQMRRDSDFEPDDVVRLAFDTFGRQRDGYLSSLRPPKKTLLRSGRARRDNFVLRCVLVLR